MPAKDKCEEEVVEALQKAQWKITKRTIQIRLGAGFVYADLQAEQNTNQIIVLEVKCFTNPRTWSHDLFLAIGQYLIYRSSMLVTNHVSPLYLAIPFGVYQTLFMLPAVKHAVQTYDVKMLVVDIVKKEIVTWRH